jgi:predicted dehydrogenase
MNDEPVPVAVVGAGNMGANHVRVYDELPGAELREVVETDPERAREIRSEYGARVVNEVDDISEAMAATVAVPNEMHPSVAVECIEHGLDVLVEKPLALTVEDAETIVETADSHEAVLQVGHIERFNPAVQVLQEILKNQEVIAIEAHRLGPFTDHLSKESVVFDLMIHDLDIIDMLGESPLARMESFGSTARSEAIDHAICVLEYENGILGAATASHVTHGKERDLNVTTEESYIKLNYQEQDIILQRRGSEQTTSLLSRGGYRTESVTETPFIRTREPLGNELEHFLECVRTRDQPLVGGDSGIRAVQLASEVVEQVSKNY